MEPGGCSISTEYLLLSGHGKEKRVRAVLVRMPGLGAPPRKAVLRLLAAWRAGFNILPLLGGGRGAGRAPRAEGRCRYGAAGEPGTSAAVRPLRGWLWERGRCRVSAFIRNTHRCPARPAACPWGREFVAARGNAEQQQAFGREEVCLLPRLLPAGSRSPSLKPERLPSLGPNTVFRTPTFKELPPIDSLNPSVGSRKE